MAQHSSAADEVAPLNLQNKPTLSMLINMSTQSGDKIKVIESIGAKHTSLGAMLLDDDTGAKTDGIIASHPHQPTHHILASWLQDGGREPVTWATLIDVLKRVGLKQLAQDIEKLAKPSQHVHNPLSPAENELSARAQPLVLTTAVPGSAASPLPRGSQQSVGPAPSAGQVQEQQGRESVGESDLFRSSNEVKRKIRALKNGFQELKITIRECLEKHKVLVKKVADVLTQLSPDDDEHHKMFLESHVKDLDEAANHSQLFLTMNSHWNYLDPSLLDHMVNELGLDDVKEEMEAYEEDLQKFRKKTPLALFCATQKKKKKELRQGFNEVVAEFNRPSDVDVTLEIVEQFRQEYASRYSVHEFAMMLAQVRPGSFIITLFIPESIIEKLKESDNVPRDILEKYSVSKLEVAGTIIYPDHGEEEDEPMDVQSSNDPVCSRPESEATASSSEESEESSDEETPHSEDASAPTTTPNAPSKNIATKLAQSEVRGEEEISRFPSPTPKQEVLREEECDEGTLVGDEGTTGQEGGGGGVVSGQGRGAEVAGVSEIMEEILGQLPISHLYSSCRLVCRKWNDIIQREKFLYWKKLYYRYKSGRCSQSQQTVASLTWSVWWSWTSSVTLRTITEPLARFVSGKFRDLGVGEEVEKRLVCHPRSHCVVRIRELFPSVDSPQGCSAVATAVLLVLCSRSVPEVQWVIESLLLSPCKRVEVMEVFYCLATFCIAGAHDTKKLPMRIHYNLFYAINLSERGSCGVAASELVSKSLSGQQSLHKYCGSSSRELTAEQAQVVNYKLQPGEVIKIMAFAGTGKTTTLLRFTALNTHMRFLYCVYNKSVQEHAATVFPPNVKCRTFHSLAHGSRGDPVAVGWKYFSKRGSINSYNISQCVKEKPEDQPLLRFCRHILQTLEKFTASGDDQFLDKHIPTTIKRRRNDRVTTEEHAEQMRKLMSPKNRLHILREAVNIWERMVDTRDDKVRMSDDGYLKLFQLSRPEISGYDCLLVDEAQDLTPAMISLVTNQSCAKIFVGDTHQQIYGFRGATNALEQISANKLFHLTESFRFGPEIAYVAACTLSVVKDVWRQTLIGSSQPGRLDGTPEGQVAIIARMNITLFEEMVKTIRSGRSLRLGFAGGIQKYEFDMYLDLHKLLHGKNSEITHRFVKKWKSFNSLVSFAEMNDDVSLLNKITVCQKYQDLPGLIQKIRSMHSRDLSLADIVFSTAHKSKGLEFDTVQLTDDYLSQDDKEHHSMFSSDAKLSFMHEDGDSPPTARPPDIEEGNILYVAITRARRSLILTRSLAKLLRDAGEHFVYPSMENSELTEGVCSVCWLHNPYPPLHLQSLPLKFTPESHQGTFKAGMVCTNCSSVTLPFLQTPS